MDVHKEAQLVAI